MGTVFNYNINKLNKTEYIFEVTGMLTSITNTIVGTHDHKENLLSDEYLRHLTGIYQTTSVDNFNWTFTKHVTYSYYCRKVTNSPALRSQPSINFSTLTTHRSIDQYQQL